MTRPIPEAQDHELRARFAAYYEGMRTKRELHPGMLVVERPGIGMFKRGPHDEHVSLMFWRWFSQSDPVDLEIIKDHITNHNILRVDCIVGFVSDQGDTVVFVPMDSATLRAQGPENP